MKFEVDNFGVKDVVFGDRTKFENNILAINKQEAIEFIKRDEYIIEYDTETAKPGDEIRIVPIKEAVEPRTRPDERAVLPSITGELVPTGEGRAHALKGVDVLDVGVYWGSFGDGFLDMSGEGANYSCFSQLVDVCLVIDTGEEFERHEQQKKNHAIRWACHLSAKYLGQTVIGQQPEEIKKYESTPVTKRGDEINKLSSVVSVMQPRSQMGELGYNDLTYDWDMNKYLPTFISPTEVLDGCIIDGSFMPYSSKWATYDLQDFPIIKELFREHRKSVNFLGVTMSNLDVSLEQEERATIFVSNMAKSLGADGATVTEKGYGNSDANYVRCICALEDVGVRVVGVNNKCTGRDGRSQPLVVMNEKADALVSIGSASQLIRLKPMKRIIGELETLVRGGLSGGWTGGEILGPSVKEGGSVVMENDAMFCRDQIAGQSGKTMKEYQE